MGNFNEAYNITILGNEGGLNPGEGEAFTYRGIDESQNPQWKWFAFIHQIYQANKDKGLSFINNLLATNTELQNDIQSFYKSGYWNTLSLDKVNDNQVTDILFDDSVNPCEINAAHVMQTAVVTCGTQLNVDGIIGQLTINAINSINAKTYYNAIITIRKFHYNDEVIKHPQQRQWLANWLNRLKPYQTV